MAELRRWEEHGGAKVIIEWDGTQFRAFCREYDLAATGKTLNEARDALISMIQHFLSLTDVQTWNEFFTSVQEEIDEDINNRWASGEHAVVN
jgi:hypothetical protein